MRPRIAEALDFVKEMGFHKIGFAACLAFEYEMKTIREIFVKEELYVIDYSSSLEGEGEFLT